VIKLPAALNASWLWVSWIITHSNGRNTVYRNKPRRQNDDNA
jgi:hypothetical protein